jgi:predicted anti-sigma-YlaC factor YlaD
MLQALLDGALRADDAARLRDHLAACDACRARFDSLRLVHEALTTQPEPEPSPDLAAAIIARARAQRGRARRAVFVPVWLEGWTLGSVGLALAACGLVISRHLVGPAVPEEVAARVTGLLPVGLVSAFGLFGLWYYRA